VILVDTSVWVVSFRVATGPEADHLRELIDRDAVALAAPVRVEILAGASLRDLSRLRRVLSALPLFFPGHETWQRVDDLLDRAAAAGDHFGFADLLIGAMSAEHRCPIWSLDSDFARMARLGLLERYSP
jgi:predicted nucleic acid-binding protein